MKTPGPANGIVQKMRKVQIATAAGGRLAVAGDINRRQLAVATATLHRLLLPVYRRLPPAIWTLRIFCAIPLAGPGVFNQSMDFQQITDFE